MVGCWTCRELIEQAIDLLRIASEHDRRAAHALKVLLDGHHDWPMPSATERQRIERHIRQALEQAIRHGGSADQAIRQAASLILGRPDDDQALAML